jgi:flagellar motility protein MotE (MotC chaperone)
MLRLLQSGWAAMLVGGLSYFAMTAALIAPVHLGRSVPHEVPDEFAFTGGPAWDFVNPELDRLVAELKAEKQALAERQQQLNELAERLDAERVEINVITQAVHRMRTDFDQHLVQVREEEVANLKRLAKVYASMSPEGAAGILKQMEDEQALKFMVFMKDAETGPLLEALAQMGEAEAKRAAVLTDRLRTTTYRSAVPKQ